MGKLASTKHAKYTDILNDYLFFSIRSQVMYSSFPYWSNDSLEKLKPKPVTLPIKVSCALCLKTPTPVPRAVLKLGQHN